MARADISKDLWRFMAVKVRHVAEDPDVEQK